MGGAGSGRLWHFGARRTTESCPDLDIRHLVRNGSLEPGRAYVRTWRWRHGRQAQIGYRVHGDEDGRAKTLTLAYTVTADGEAEVATQPTDLTWTSCHYGGRRPWFLCPGCGRRCAILYGRRRFACRTCQRLAYSSQNESTTDRQMRKAQAIRERLGGSPDLGLPFLPKPPRMHWRTYWRLRAEAGEAEASMWAGVAERFGLAL
ncbi:MAG: hypothetical protein LC667_06100 [Thioalkalivibrio sp.]|nr:hypothetical protein [Thioalkalivibrio sp.]